MKPKDRLITITNIALHLQEEYNTSDINILLEGYGIRTDNVTSVINKRIYVINLLKSQKEDLIIKIANDLELKLDIPTLKTTDIKTMKIFISHSSKNANYGIALVNLLTGIGIKSDQIIFTSNTAYGIPIGQNIFNWLKDRINEKPFVIYLLSTDYYSSVACLNEMGAAWVVENQHAMIFTPDFDLTSYEFQNGVLDPREIGFYINSEDRLTAFVESMKETFELFTNQVLINQKCREFTKQIDSLSGINNQPPNKRTDIVAKQADSKSDTDKQIKAPKEISNNVITRYFNDLISGKLKDEEVLIIQYVFDTVRIKLLTGWQQEQEQNNIKIWEDINDLNNIVSNNYDTIIRRLEMRKLIEVSETTSQGNPKEYKLIEEMQSKLLDLPDEFHIKVDEIKKKIKEDELPF